MGKSFSRGLLKLAKAQSSSRPPRIPQASCVGALGLDAAATIQMQTLRAALLDSLPKIHYSRLQHMSQPLKPRALRSGDAIRVLSLSSPVVEERVKSGCDELTRLGYAPKWDR